MRGRPGGGRGSRLSASVLMLLCGSRYRHTRNKRCGKQQRTRLFCHFFLHQDAIPSFNRLNGGGFSDPAVQSYGCDGT
jgi:hypothetical protein